MKNKNEFLVVWILCLQNFVYFNRGFEELNLMFWGINILLYIDLFNLYF